MSAAKRFSVAVIGGGVAGVTASYLLQQQHDVTLFERNDYVGGHTNTVVIPNGPDEGLGVDTGFIVLNDQNYPNFHRFLQRLQVPVRWSDMSFGFMCEATGLEYACTTVNGLFAQRSNLFRPSFYRLFAEILRFAKRGNAVLSSGDCRGRTLGQFLDEEKFSPEMVRNYILPMGAAIWSASDGSIREFPLSSFLHFFRNHGLLGIRNRPRWQTVVGGSFNYIKRFRENFQGQVRISSPVVSIQRAEGRVEVRFENETAAWFDRIVIATHADEALALLSDHTEHEKRLLGAWRYQKNHTVLHTDTAVLPMNKRAWASWNYRRGVYESSEQPVSVTYHMNRLQGLRAASEYCVSLNMGSQIDPKRIIKEIEYYHPIYDFAAIRSQSELPSLNGKNNTWFCGSYFGYGFHEDAVRSAVMVGKDFGIAL